jgi:hypothetical protein
MAKTCPRLDFILMLIATMQHPERRSLFHYVMELRFEGTISLCSFRDRGKIVQNMTLLFYLFYGARSCYMADS